MNRETLERLAPGTDWSAVLSLPQEEQVAVIINAMREDVAKTNTLQITQAARTVYLKDDCGRSVGSIADEVGVSEGTVRTWYDRGKVLTLTGPATALKTWDQLSALSRDQVQALQSECLSLTTPEDRAAHVTRTALSQVANNALGDNSTPERVQSLVAAMQADGNDSPQAARKAVEPTATRLGIALGERKRAPQEAEPVTITGAVTALLKALADRRTAGSPLQVTREEAAALGQAMDVIAAFIDEATVASAQPRKAAQPVKA